MCGSRPSTASDDSARIAREQEAQRQARISEGQTAIDNAFVGYTPDFYNQYQTDYTNYYMPQLDDQYSDARERLTLQLAKTGNLTSQHGADEFADLQEFYGNQQTGITNQALDASNQFQSQVDSRKSQLYADNRAAADPGNASAAAASAAQSLQPTMPTSPLANVFADFFGNAGNAAAINNTAGRRYSNTGVQTYGSGGGSGSYQVFD